MNPFQVITPAEMPSERKRKYLLNQNSFVAIQLSQIKYASGFERSSIVTKVKNKQTTKHYRSLSLVAVYSTPARRCWLWWNMMNPIVCKFCMCDIDAVHVQTLPDFILLIKFIVNVELSATMFGV